MFWLRTTTWLSFLGLLCFSSPSFATNFETLKSAANSGNASVQADLSLAYLNGDGTQKDYAKARKWLEMAAAQNNAVGQNNLGLMYQQGLGVEKDITKAKSYFRKAAKQGMHAAQYNLGVLLEKNSTGNQDIQEAVRMYEMASKHPTYQWPQYRLGEMYRLGKTGKRDYQTASKWYRKAAMRGHKWSQFAIAKLIEFGAGDTKDKWQALVFYRLAAFNGHNQGQKHYRDLSKKLGTELNQKAMTFLSGRDIRLTATVLTNEGRFATNPRHTNTTTIAAAKPKKVQKPVQQPLQPTIKPTSEQSLLAQIFPKSYQDILSFDAQMEAAQAGDIQAAFTVGKTLIYGGELVKGRTKIKPNIPDGRKFLELAAEKGVVDAHGLLALSYSSQPPLNLKKARHWAAEGIEYNDRQSAQTMLELVVNGTQDHLMDLDKAQDLLSNTNYFPASQSLIARDMMSFARGMLLFQRDTNPEYKKAAEAMDKREYDTARPLLEKLAQQGHFYSMVWLGRLHQLGVFGEKNFKQARKWYGAAIAQKEATPPTKQENTLLSLAYRGLAVLHYNGQGLQADKSKAITYFKKAALLNSGNAQLILADIFFNGDGVQKDRGEALRWLYISAKNTNTLATIAKKYAALTYKKDEIEQTRQAVAKHVEQYGYQLQDLKKKRDAGPKIIVEKGVPKRPISESAGYTQEFEVLSKRPPSENNKIIANLKSKLTSLTPPYIFELARRTFDTDKNQSLTYFWLAKFRADIDAAKCVDKTAKQGTRQWDAWLSNIVEYSRDFDLASREAMKAAYALEQSFPTDSSPRWICFHGIQAMQKLQKNTPVTNWHRPKDEWQKLRKKEQSKIQMILSML